MAYEIVWEPQGVHKRLWGAVAAGEFLEAVEAVQLDRRFPALRYVINDFSDVVDHSITEEAIRELAARKYGAHGINPRCRVFFVTREERLARLINRHLVDGRRIGYQVAVTRTLDQARFWLENRPASFRLPIPPAAGVAPGQGGPGTV